MSVHPSVIVRHLRNSPVLLKQWQDFELAPVEIELLQFSMKRGSISFPLLLTKILQLVEDKNAGTCTVSSVKCALNDMDLKGIAEDLDSYDEGTVITSKPKLSIHSENSFGSTYGYRYIRATPNACSVSVLQTMPDITYPENREQECILPLNVYSKQPNEEIETDTDLNPGVRHKLKGKFSRTLLFLVIILLVVLAGGIGYLISDYSYSSSTRRLHLDTPSSLTNTMSSSKIENTAHIFASTVNVSQQRGTKELMVSGIQRNSSSQKCNSVMNFRIFPNTTFSLNSIQNLPCASSYKTVSIHKASMTYREFFSILDNMPFITTVHFVGYVLCYTSQVPKSVPLDVKRQNLNVTWSVYFDEDCLRLTSLFAKNLVLEFGCIEGTSGPINLQKLYDASSSKVSPVRTNC